MDYDLWIRLSRISTPTMIDENWAYFRFHGEQKTSLPNLLLQKREMTEILKRESASPWIIIKLRCKKRWHWTKASIKLLLISVGVLSSKYQQRPLRVNVGDKK